MYPGEELVSVVNERVSPAGGPTLAGGIPLLRPLTAGE